jgi:O-antigen ligase
MTLQFLIPILYPAALLAFALSMWKPEVGVYFLTFVLPLQTLRYEIFDYPMGANIIDLVLFGIVMGVWLNGRAGEFVKIPVRGIVLLFAVYSYLSLWYGTFALGFALPTSAADPRVSVWRTWAEFGLMSFVCYAAIKTRNQIETAVAVMCVTALMLSWDFFQVMSFRDLSHYSWELRYAGVMGFANANGLAAFEVMFILFLIGFFSLKLPLMLKLLIPPTIFFCGYGLLFTFSRGAYIGLVLGVIALGLIRKNAYVVVLMAVLAGGSMLLPASVTDRIAGTYSEGDTTTEATLDHSTMERVMIWENAIDLTKSHPLFGLGFDSYAFLHPYGFKDTHNFYLKILVEQGIIGLIVFLVLMWKIFLQGYKLFRDGSDPLLSSLGLGFALSVVGALVVNFFGDRWSYLQVDSYLWITLALVCRGRALVAAPATAPIAAPEIHVEFVSPLQPAR